VREPATLDPEALGDSRLESGQVSQHWQIRFPRPERSGFHAPKGRKRIEPTTPWVYVVGGATRSNEYRGAWKNWGPHHGARQEWTLYRHEYSVVNRRLWRRHPDREHHGLVPLRCLQEQTVLRWDTPVHRFFGPRAQHSPRRITETSRLALRLPPLATLSSINISQGSRCCSNGWPTDKSAQDMVFWVMNRTAQGRPTSISLANSTISG
jgi:hypothetical protein